jgi:predicted transcriptional regulator
MSARDDIARRLAESVKSSEFVELTVRDFIERWNAERRGERIVARIRDDLSKAKLTTEPDFRHVSIDSKIRVVSSDTPVAEAEEAEAESREYALTVGTLPSAGGGVVSVKPMETLQLAYTRMLLNDFSQLPIMDGPRSLKGAVTWRSITSALLKSSEATLADAVVHVNTVKYSEDLLKLTPRIVAEDFVLVVDQTDQVAGIVTTADVSKLVAERAETFIMLGEVDQRLRDAIMKHLDLPTIRPLCKRPDGEEVNSFDELTMGDYEQILANPDCWEQVGWPLDRAEVRSVMEEVREVRNDVMHFNPDPIEPDRLGKLRGFVDLLREHS